MNACTELVTVDALAPRGERWRDFTFNAEFLEQELARQARLRGQDMEMSERKHLMSGNAELVDVREETRYEWGPLGSGKQS